MATQSEAINPKYNELIKKLEQLNTLVRSIQSLLDNLQLDRADHVPNILLFAELETTNTAISILVDRIKSIQNEYQAILAKTRESSTSIIVRATSYRYISISSPPFINPLMNWEFESVDE